MDEKAVERIAEDAAERAAAKAVRETFRLLGVDTSDQKSVNELRSDLVYTRELRRASSAIKGRVGLLLAAAIALGAMNLFWDAIKAKLSGG